MSITSKNGFRYFVLFGWLVGFGAFIDVVFPSLLSEELQEYFSGTKTSSYGIFLAIYSFTLSLLGIAALFGVLLYRRWARMMTLVLTVISILLTPIYTELVSSGVSSAFSSLSGTCSSVALAMMYLSPVKEYFQSRT